MIVKLHQQLYFLSLLYKKFNIVAGEMAQWSLEHLLLWKKTQAWFIAPTSGDSHPSITPVPRHRPL